MTVNRNDVDQVFNTSGQVIASVPIVRDITVEANRATIQQAAANALQANRDFLALPTPTNPQALAQIQALTRQNIGIIRLLLNQLDATS